MSKVLYMKLNEISEVHDTQVTLGDVAQLYSDDKKLLRQCEGLNIKTLENDKDWRYVENVLLVIEKIHQLDDSVQIVNLGETDFIIDYQKTRQNKPVWQWIKTGFVAAICFVGAAFAIMTFNNDASVSDVFTEVYKLVLGDEGENRMILEISYSLGLTVGIVVFFNHFSVWKLNTDPTPLEVEMRLYEDNISKTLIQNDGRKESGIDVT